MKKHQNNINVIIGGVLIGVAVVCAATWFVLKPCKKTVVLDTNLVQKESILFQKIVLEQQKHETFLKTQVMVLQDILEKDAQKLEKGKKSMSAAELKKAQTELNEKAATLQKRYQAEVSRIMAVSEQVGGRVNVLFNEAIASFAKENGYRLIVPKNSVLFSKKCLDVTADFIRTLNEKTASVTYAELSAVPNTPQQVSEDVKQETAQEQPSQAEKVKSDAESKEQDKK